MGHDSDYDGLEELLSILEYIDESPLLEASEPEEPLAAGHHESLSPGLFCQTNELHLLTLAVSPVTCKFCCSVSRSVGEPPVALRGEGEEEEEEQERTSLLSAAAPLES